MFQVLFTTVCLIGVASCRKIVRKPTKDPFHDFIGDPDLEIPEEDDDTVWNELTFHIFQQEMKNLFNFQPPTNFTGNVQTAKITNSVNKNHGKGKFKYT